MKKIPDNQIAFYQSQDGSVNIEVMYAEENIWLTQKKMADLFDCSTDNISLHLKNIYKERELDQSSTTEDFSVVQKEGDREILRTLTFYSLEAIIAVGYRVNNFEKIIPRQGLLASLKFGIEGQFKGWSKT